MGVRSFLAGVGVGFTAFALTAAVVIEIVQVDPGAGILGVGLGAIVAIGVLTVVTAKLDDVDGPLRWGVEAVAWFGWTALFLLFLSYGDIAGLRSATSIPSTVAVAAAVAVVVFARGWFRRGRTGPA